MHIQDRIKAFSALGQSIHTKLEDGSWDGPLSKAYFENQWFTQENSKAAIKSIATQYLDAGKIEAWLANYPLPDENNRPKTIGLVMAGNIPLVGWQDLMCVLVTGNKALVKLSSKDKTLPNLFINELLAIEPRFADQIQLTEAQLSGFDAIIATGSNNTQRYFEYYFGKYPHILRKNRNSLAILTGNESNVELNALGEDIMAYFGLGCRNVSSLMVPPGYDFREFFEALEPWNNILEHNKYANNYMYNKSLLLLNKEKHLDNGFLLLKESTALATPVSVVNYQIYQNLEAAVQYVEANHADIQCVVALPGVAEGAIHFGHTQSPGLSDYADGVDVVGFLQTL